MGKRIGVLLSGCGVYDGAEIHESVITLLALDRAGASVICMAPDMPQFHVINHLTGQEMAESRNVLVESARIARGAIKDIKEVTAQNLDALIMPGGFGAAKNLSDFAINGPQGKVHPEVRRLINEMLDSRKPIGAMCIAPATLVLAAKEASPRVTIGNDPATAQAMESLGAFHKNAPVDGIVVDQVNRLVSTPAYMLGPGIKEVAVGIEKLVQHILAMTD